MNGSLVIQSSKGYMNSFSFLSAPLAMPFNWLFCLILPSFSENTAFGYFHSMSQMTVQIMSNMP